MGAISEFIHAFSSSNTMELLLLLLIVGSLITLLVMHFNPKSTVNITDLVSIKGKLDEKKFTRFGAWIVSTWGFVFLVVQKNLTEWYFIGYMGAWVVNAIMDKYVNKPKPDDKPDS